MDGVKTYIVSVAAAAILVGILTELTGKKDTTGVLLRMIGGLFLAFTVIRPVISLNVGDIGSYLAAFSDDGTAAAAEGEILARDAYCSYIKSETEAYILDKADAYGVDLTVEVTLSEEAAVPVEARIQGRASPYAKLCIQALLEEDLGIAKENQIWIG